MSLSFFYGSSFHTLAEPKARIVTTYTCDCDRCGQTREVEGRGERSANTDCPNGGRWHPSFIRTV